MDLFAPLTEQEINELDEFLLNLPGEDAILGMSELDGLLAAVVSGPSFLPPSEWLDAVWGGADAAPAWESEEQFSHVLSLIMRQMNCIAAVLMESPANYEAMFLQHEVEGKLYNIVDEWCEGFVCGMSLRADEWNAMPNMLEDYLAPILMFTTETGFQLIENMEEQEVEFWQQQIEPAVQRIHAYWLAQRAHMAPPPGQEIVLPMSAANDEPYVRDEDKVGRNDPCPCGSGKKYKKCCGLN